MLVLKRKVGERIFIVDEDTGEKIEVMLITAGGHQCPSCGGQIPESRLAGCARIGIEAADKYRIVREELESSGPWRKSRR